MTAIICAPIRSLNRSDVGTLVPPGNNHFRDTFRFNREGSLSAEVHHHSDLPLHCHPAACHCLWLAERRKHKRRDRWASSPATAAILVSAADGLSLTFNGRCSEDHCWPEHWRGDLRLICWVTTCHSPDHCAACHLHQRCVPRSAWLVCGERGIGS